MQVPLFLLKICLPYICHVPLMLAVRDHWWGLAPSWHPAVTKHAQPPSTHGKPTVSTTLAWLTKSATGAVVVWAMLLNAKGGAGFISRQWPVSVNWGAPFSENSCCSEEELFRRLLSSHGVLACSNQRSWYVMVGRNIFCRSPYTRSLLSEE